jgi:hypothetical protein
MWGILSNATDTGREAAKRSGQLVALLEDFEAATRQAAKLQALVRELAKGCSIPIQPLPCDGKDGPVRQDRRS